MKIFAILFLIFTSKSYTQVTFNEYKQVKSALENTYEILRNDNRRLLINAVSEGLPENYWWNLEVSHASYVNVGDVHHIYLMGGLAREKFMTPDGLALIGCHELGHGLAGSPFKNPLSANDYLVSVEGQSDYFATKECLKIVFDFLPAMRNINQSSIYKSLCKHSDVNCLRMLTAIESELNLFQKNTDIVLTVDGTSDIIVEKINHSPYYYPDPQCRIQTMVHGVLELPRPSCWYTEN